MFKTIASQARLEDKTRRGMTEKRLTFGVKFLDDSLRGIRPDDMILLGAVSGMGKTQLVTIIANANLMKGRKVHLLALESSEFEIVQRIKYSLTVGCYWADTGRKPIYDLNYADWMDGKFCDKLDFYEEQINEHIEKNYQNFHIYSKGDKFGVSEMIQSICYCQKETDLIIIDHAHYFDYDGDNENKALKEIAKTVRMLSLDYRKPIILVAHLRKRDRQNEDLAPGMEEFHGSSDLFKIATKVITMAPGSETESGKFETFIRLPKSRIDGTVSRYLGRTLYDPKKGTYENEYKVGWSHCKKPGEKKDGKQTGGFAELGGDYVPKWANNGGRGNGSDNASVSVASKPIPNVANEGRQRSFDSVSGNYKGY